MTWTLGITLYLAISALFCWFVCGILRMSRDDDATYGAETADD